MRGHGSRQRVTRDLEEARKDNITARQLRDALAAYDGTPANTREATGQDLIQGNDEPE